MCQMLDRLKENGMMGETHETQATPVT